MGMQPKHRTLTAVSWGGRHLGGTQPWGHSKVGARNRGPLDASVTKRLRQALEMHGPDLPFVRSPVARGVLADRRGADSGSGVR